ncbi:MAG: tetratricopeptide repeat protein [Cyclobacteriaceae bacterium]
MKKSLLLLTLLLSLQSLQAQSWKALYDSTELYWNSDWSKCIDLLERALPLAESDLGQQNANYLVLANDLGLAYLESGLYGKAQPIFEGVVATKKEQLGINHPEYATSLLNLAGIYQDQGFSEQAEKLYLEAIENYKVSLGDEHPDYATAIQNLGYLYESNGYYSRAEDLYLNAIRIRKFAIGDVHPNYASSLHSLGQLYSKTGEYEKAQKNLTNALNIFEKSNGKRHPSYASTLNDLGILYQSTGKYALAEETLIRTAELRKQTQGDTSEGYAEALNNLGSLQRAIGNYEKAEQSFLVAKENYKRLLGENEPRYGTVLNNLADFYTALLDFDQAKLYYQQASSIFRSSYGDRHPLYANALNNLASLYRKTGNFKEAQLLYEKTLEIDKATLGTRHPAYATSLNNLAILHVATKKYGKAEPLYLEALKIKRATLGENHPSYAKSLNNLALLYLTQGDLVRAEPLFLQAIQNQLDQIESIFPSLSEKEKEAFYNTLKSDLERFNTFAYFRLTENPAIISALYNQRLTTKALLFNSGIKMRNNIFSSGDEALIEDFNKWRGLKEELGRLYQLPKMELEKKLEDIEKLREETNSLEKSLTKRSNSFAKENTKQGYTWEDVRDHLTEGEAAVEIIRFRRYKIEGNVTEDLGQEMPTADFLNYGFTDEVFYAALIVTNQTKDHPEVVFMENGNDLEQRYLSYYKNSVQYVLEDKHSYREYWGKIKVKIPEANRIYFSADGVYHKINLNAIKNPRAGYLIDEVEIVPVTNTKDLLQQAASFTDNLQATLIGNPDFGAGAVLERDKKAAAEYLDDLPGTGKEVAHIDEIAKKHGWTNQLYTGEKAEESIVKTTKSPRVLHIATHGFFSDRVLKINQPLMNSGILLAGASNSLMRRDAGITAEPDQEDGILTAYEAMNLNLDQTELVVLSACETGLGTVKNGEGVYGLQRAFKVAGAQSMIISLWKVDDQTTQKMLEYFYQAWLKGVDKRTAFKQAQLKVREAYPYPYYWGAFVMIGS